MSRFTHIIFDVDETLYPRSAGLLEEVNRRISLWVQRDLDLTPEEGDALRRAYFRRYGTTLGGLVAECQVDVDAYLDFTHDVPVERYLRPSSSLTAMLSAIPLRRVAFTNAPSEHGRRVLQAMGLSDLFERVIGIREVGLHSKPQVEAYERMLQILDLSGSSCIMVEDRAVNLRPAKRLGMTTVLIDAVPGEGVDFVVENILDVGPLVSRLVAEA